MRFNYQKVKGLIKKTSVKNVGVYFFAALFNKGLAFFLLPVLTKYLTPAEYGVIGIYQVIFTFMLSIVGMGMNTNITRNFYRKEKDYVAKIIFNSLIILTTTTILFLVGLFIYTYFQGGLLGIPQRWIMVLPLITFMNFANQLNLIVIRNKKKAITYSMLEIFQTAFNLGITILFVVVYLMGWEGRLLGMLVAEILFGLIGLGILLKTKYLKFKIDRKIIKSILIISTPLILHSISTAIMSLSDRIYLDKMIGKDAVGIYSVGYQFGMVLLLLNTAFNRSWSPWVYQKLASATKGIKKTIVKITYLYQVSIIPLALLITGASYFLIRWMTTSEFHSSFQFVIWVALGYAMWGMYTMVFPYLVHVGKTRFLGLMSGLAAVFNLVANYFLIKWNGAIGAAQATFISYLFLFFIIWWYSNRVYPMPWLTFWKREADDNKLIEENKSDDK